MAFAKANISHVKSAEADRFFERIATLGDRKAIQAASARRLLGQDVDDCLSGVSNASVRYRYEPRRVKRRRQLTPMRSRFLTAIDRVDRLGDPNPIHPNTTTFPQARRTGAFDLRAYPSRPPPSKARYRPKQTDGNGATEGESRPSRLLRSIAEGARRPFRSSPRG